MVGVDSVFETHGAGTSLSKSCAASGSVTSVVVFICSFAVNSEFVSSITYGGVNVPQANSSGNTGGFGGWIGCWVLPNAPSGTQTCTANFNTTIGGNGAKMVVLALNNSYQGLNYTSSRGGNNFAQGFNSAGGPQATSIAPIRTGSVGLFCWFGSSNSGGFTTQTGGTTNILNQDTGGGNGNIAVVLDTANTTANVGINDGWSTLVSNLYEFSVIEIFAPSSNSTDSLFFAA